METYTINGPKLAEGQSWKIDGYLVGKHVRVCPKKFTDFDTQFIGKSNGSYHFIGDGNKVLICSIQID